jgi:hypothetical protein
MKEEALKLAEALYEKRDVFTGSLLEDSSAMIRRLVEELDELKHDNEELLRCLTAEQEHNEMLEQGEPVAWWFEKDGAYMAMKHIDGVNFEGGIPLYTTPQTKPLSDEKIIETVKNHFTGAIKLGIVLTNDNVLGFARAIEERHGIK